MSSIPILDNMPGVRPSVTEASHLPADFYTSETIYQLEKEKIFLKEWLSIGRLEEIPNAGDFLTFNIVGRPIIAARNERGEINAFSAVCRHRGALVATSPGHTNRFKCPFHAWTYDLEGKLVGAPFMEDSSGFDRADFNLTPLRTHVWGGFVFVNFDPDAKDFMTALGDFGVYIDEIAQKYGFSDLKTGKKFSISLDANWKLLFEQLSDHYHTSLLHGDKIEKIQPLKGFKDKVFDRGGHSNYFSGGLAPAFDGKPRLGPMKSLSGRELEGGHIIHIWPNTTIVPRVDSLTYVTTWPQGVDKAVYLGSFLFEPSAFGRPQFDDAVNAYTEYCSAILKEDVDVIASVQRSLASGAFIPGRMSKYENLINRTLGYFVERLKQ